MESTVATNQSAVLVGSESQFLVVEQGPCCRVCRQQNLKAAIQSKAIDDVRSDTSTDCIRCFEEQERSAAAM